MTRDFSQSSSSGRQTRSNSAMPGWLWLLVGVAIGFVAAAGYYISRPTTDAQNALEAPDGKSKSAGKKNVAIPPKEPSRFAFYELLPNYEVVIPRESLKPETQSTGTAAAGASGEPGVPSERFLIQVGSFKDRREAEQQKANLALLGIESRVEQVTIDNKQTWYRVRVGPEKDPERVQNILAQLDDNQIKALVMRVPE